MEYEYFIDGFSAFNRKINGTFGIKKLNIPNYIFLYYNLQKIIKKQINFNNLSFIDAKFINEDNENNYLICSFYKIHIEKIQIINTICVDVNNNSDIDNIYFYLNGCDNINYIKGMIKTENQIYINKSPHIIKQSILNKLL